MLFSGASINYERLQFLGGDNETYMCNNCTTYNVIGMCE